MALDDWNDLRFLLAVHRQRSPLKAAAELGISYATVMRRLSALEKQAGVKLLNRNRRAYELTVEGHKIVAVAERIERETKTIGLKEISPDQSYSGLVKIACGEGIGAAFLARGIDVIRDRFPNIRVKVSASSTLLNVDGRSAHLHIRPLDTITGTSKDLVHWYLGPINFAFYGSASYLRDRPPIGRVSDLKKHVILNGDPSIQYVQAFNWLAQNVPGEAIGLESSGVFFLAKAAEVGWGLAILPCMIGEDAPELRQVLGPRRDWATKLWLMGLKQVTEAPHVKAVAATLVEFANSNQGWLRDGRKGSSDT